MGKTKKSRNVTHPECLRSYFLMETGTLAMVTGSGLIYNIGMIAGPYYEGQLVGCLNRVIGNQAVWTDMLQLSVTYLSVILLVQGMRCLKRLYVRRFANNINQDMKHMLYNCLVYQKKSWMEQESTGALMTRAVSDVDACVEGMRKFTTEIFDTGVVLIAYFVMLFRYDWRLTLLVCLFPPLAYVIADRMKILVYRYAATYKESAGRLNDATMDRVSLALTYRIFGREKNRDEAYEDHLADYEKQAVRANGVECIMPPLYQVISMTGVIFIIYMGARNMAGQGWSAWDIAVFTTYLSCFTKLSVKSSHAAKLFNAVQKAGVSWKRIRPFMKPFQTTDRRCQTVGGETGLSMKGVSFAYPGGERLIQDFSMEAARGEIIGITGPIASGKSTIGRLMLCEWPYEGSIQVGGHELSDLGNYERSQMISYLGHQPELMSDTLEENILLGGRKEDKNQPLKTVADTLQEVCLEQEVLQMPQGIHTELGEGGVRLSGGQQARVALARTLYHGGEILVLDDPFAAVDVETETEILSHIKRDFSDRIILLISHRLFHFPEFSKVVWLEGGRGTVSTHQKLMSENASYASLYHAQMEGGEEG